MHPKPLGQRVFIEVIWVISCIFVVLFMRAFVFGVYEIPSESMMPTLQVGDRVLGSKIQPKLSGVHRGDIIIFHDPSYWLNTGPTDDFLIKRVIGVAGDRIAADGSGPVYVNGKKLQDSSFIMSDSVSSQVPFAVTVDEGFVFVMGDNRANSADSRFHLNDKNGGQVPLEKIDAVANVTYWPVNRIGLIRRPKTLF